MNTSYDVRVWAIREHVGKGPKTGKSRKTYRVRWLVAGQEFGESFKTYALAESFRSKLITAQREGVAFDTASGLPEPEARKLNSRSWYEHTVAFVDTKWVHSSAKHRRSIAESLAFIGPALLATKRGAPSDAEIRTALRTWAYNKASRDAGPPPLELAPTIRWLSGNTVKLTEMREPSLIRKILDLVATLRNGKAAAPTTIATRRGIFYGALRYAVELRLLESNPIDHIQWAAPISSDEVDKRSVINPEQALLLLDAASRRWPRFVAFFACMYYAALRPAEVIHLRFDDCELPESGWGMFRLTGSTQRAGRGWGDDPAAILEDRSLKHRSKKTTRPVPIAPPLVRALRWHIAEFGCGPDGRIFVGSGYGNRPVSTWSYLNVWHQARKAAFTSAQQKSPLAGRPYDLRHAAVSLWLNAGVPATQVAEWAGHSVNVLLKVYAKCIDGEEEAARRRIEQALSWVEPDVQ